MEEEGQLTIKVPSRMKRHPKKKVCRLIHIASYLPQANGSYLLFHSVIVVKLTSGVNSIVASSMSRGAALFFTECNKK